MVSFFRFFPGFCSGICGSRLFVGSNLQLGLGIFVLFLGYQTPARAAEEILASFGLIQASIPVESLETYVRDGTIDRELRPYTRYFEPEQLEELRQLLGTPLVVDRQVMTNLLYTAPGELLLKRVGAILRTRKNNGFYALRAAIVLAAWEDGEELTPLNILKRFPTDSLVIDVGEGLSIAQNVEQLINQSSDAIALVKAQYQANLANNSSLLAPDINLMNPGPYHWEKAASAISLQRRAFPVNIYLPKRHTPAPIVIISHGLGSNLDSYGYLATHLASYGFVVVALEHQGSNAEHIQSLLNGTVDEVVEPEEFINRTSDISAVLNALEDLARTNSTIQHHLDFERIGVIGQSFGGYTALALAGATFDFDNLAHHCAADQLLNKDTDGEIMDSSFNLSLILQCRALDLRTNPAFDGNNSLRDGRIDAAIAINPIGSAIFGASGFQAIDIPVMIMSGSGDIVAPTLWEQLMPFSWLQPANKFLLMMHHGTHFSTIGFTEEDIALPDVILGPTPQVAQQYTQAMSLGFFQTYLEQNLGEQDQPNLDPSLALSSSYVNSISQDSIPLSFIRHLDADF